MNNRYAITTLGDLIATLKMAAQDSRVFFSFGGCVPTTVDSYRGYYNQPALGFTMTGRHAERGSTQPPTVAALLVELNRALTDTFTGWKGGEYHYDKSDTLYVDNPGDCTNTKVCGVEIQDYEVFLLTERSDW